MRVSGVYDAAIPAQNHMHHRNQQMRIDVQFGELGHNYLRPCAGCEWEYVAGSATVGVGCGQRNRLLALIGGMDGECMARLGQFVECSIEVNNMMLFGFLGGGLPLPEASPCPKPFGCTFVDDAQSELIDD